MIVSETIAYGLLALLLLTAIVGLIFFKKIKHAYLDWRLFHAVKKLGKQSLRNAILSDGMDGTVCIDNLVLLVDEILVVSVGRYQGAVFASERIDVWTQVVGKRSYKFTNPLLKLEQDVAAVRANLPDIKVSGALVFPHDVSFPKGKPDNVISVSEAKQRFGNDQTLSVKTEYQEAWERLKTKVISET